MAESSSSSDCSYDSEEDRIQERLRSMEERAQVAARAAFESEVLRAWRERRRKTHGMAYVTGGGSGGGCGGGGDGWRASTASTASLHGESEVIAEHLRQWREFENVQAALRDQHISHELMYSDVPWIPDGISGAAYLAHVARAEHGGDVRKAHAAMRLTWHPDKFQNRYMGFFKDDAEWKRVVARVNETFAWMNET